MQQLTNRQELIGLWVKHGHDLGNHTCSHTISDNLTAEEFESGIVAGEASFAPVLARVGTSPRYFRFGKVTLETTKRSTTPSPNP